MKFNKFLKASLAILLAAGIGGNADAALQRMGPVNNSPTVGGFPA
ncbi:MAG TPA: hypothetical protein VLC55_07060 [Burkholderiales bacterium]|nr:hypothetical protein [Burkholderiales bacterium]